MSSNLLVSAFFLLLVEEAVAVASCTAIRGSDEEAFRCAALVTDDVNTKFLMRSSNKSSSVEHFELYTNLSAVVMQPPWNGSECNVHTNVEASIQYMSDVVQLNHGRHFAAGTGNCGSTFMSARLYCFRGAGASSSRLYMSVQSDENAQVVAYIRAKPGNDENHKSISMDVGGSGGRNAFHLFTIPKDDELDLWRLSMTVREEFRKPTSVYHAYILHVTSPCVSKVVDAGGCFDPVRVWSCTQSVPVSFRRPTAFGNLRISMSLSFSESARMTISRGSLPRLRSGRWVLFVVCNIDNLHQPCPEATIDVKFSAGYNQRKKLWIGAAIMIFGPAAILFVVNAMYWLAYLFLYKMSSPSLQTQDRLWPVFMSLPGRMHLDMLREKVRLISRPIPFFPALLALMIGVFLATAAQFVITHYGLMVRTGSRDICFYNEKCFSPGVVWDIPWNNFLSNLAYFVAGAHTMLQAFFAEVRCRSFLRRTMSALYKHLNLQTEIGLTKAQWVRLFDTVDLNKSGSVSRQEWHTQYGHALAFDFIDKNQDGFLSRAEWSNAFDLMDRDGDGYLTEIKFQTASSQIDLRAFYAVGTTFVAEGIGSMCYHLCPSVETFQFDTCFMIPIANLLTIALAEWSGTDLDTISALRYFVYILTPVWLINFIGTWYDIDVFDCEWLYWLYSFLVVVWTVAAVSALNRVFATPKIGKHGTWLMRALQALIIFLVLVAYVEPSVRRGLGGTANTFLLLSIIVMIVVVSRQIYLQDLQFVTCEVSEIGGRIIKYSYMAVMVFVAVTSIHFFNEKVAIVAPDATPAQSHDINQNCVFNIFDLHDYWHFLSAVALALFAMLLLDIRVNSWARKNGIQILFEQPVDYSSASDSDPESSETEGVDPETLESEDAGFEDPRSDSKIYRL